MNPTPEDEAEFQARYGMSSARALWEGCVALLYVGLAIILAFFLFFRKKGD